MHLKLIIKLQKTANLKKSQASLLTWIEKFWKNNCEIITSAYKVLGNSLPKCKNSILNVGKISVNWNFEKSLKNPKLSYENSEVSREKKFRFYYVGLELRPLIFHYQNIKTRFWIIEKLEQVEIMKKIWNKSKNFEK